MPGFTGCKTATEPTESSNYIVCITLTFFTRPQQTRRETIGYSAPILCVRLLLKAIGSRPDIVAVAVSTAMVGC